MADESLLKLPMDYQSSKVFERLAQWFDAGRPDGVRANHVYLGLWVQLAYLARDGRALGWVEGEDAPGLKRILRVVTEREEDLYQALAGDIRFFNREGERLVCPLFIALNGHLSPLAQVKRESMGGLMKAFNARAERAANPAFQQMILIASDLLRDEQGQPLPPELVRRIKYLVTVCDSALGKKTRPAHAFSPNLIQSALTVCRGLKDEEILSVCGYLAKHRLAPELAGIVTEDLLPKFGGILNELNGVG